MGANAQTAVPAFTAGQVLTAAQQTQINTGVPVFATTVTRDAAFGGTGEKTLAEGQFAYIEATNTTQYYDGASWVAVGASGLTLISSQSFTSVTSVSFNDVFTSTYLNYRIEANTGDPATSQTFTMRLRVGGTDNSSSAYARMTPGLTAGGTVLSTSGTTTSWFLGYVGNTSEFAAGFDVFHPQATARTSIAGHSISNNATFASISSHSLGGWFDPGTSFDGFTLLFGANTTGVARVYGYANS